MLIRLPGEPKSLQELSAQHNGTRNTRQLRYDSDGGLFSICSKSVEVDVGEGLREKRRTAVVLGAASGNERPSESSRVIYAHRKAKQ